MTPTIEHTLLRHSSPCMSKRILSKADISAIIELALSDHVSFDAIKVDYGLSEKDVKTLMRTKLKPGSYRAWRRRVRMFSDRRETYK